MRSVTADKNDLMRDILIVNDKIYVTYFRALFCPMILIGIEFLLGFIGEESMAEKIKFCRKCGTPRTEGAKFCRKCGFQFVEEAANNMPKVSEVAKQEDRMPNEPVNQPANQGQVNIAEKLADVMDAPFNSGTFSFAMEGMDTVEEITREVLTPFKAAAHIFPRISSGLKNFFKNPRASIPVIVLSVLWIILNFMRRSGNAGNTFARILSWISYGGYTGNRTLLGVLGTSVGRGIVALGYSSLLTGGFKKIEAGFSAMTLRQESDAPSLSKGRFTAWELVGAGAALIINRFIAGAPSWSGVVAVIAAAAVSLQAFANSNGYLYGIARSVTSTVLPGGSRTEDKNAIKKLMTGFSKGFIGMIIYTVVQALLTLVIGVDGEAFLSGLPLTVGVVLLIIGMIMVHSGKNNLTVMGDN